MVHADTSLVYWPYAYWLVTYGFWNFGFGI